MRIIAFDQSTVALGFAVMESHEQQVICSGVKRFPKLDNRNPLALEQRITDIKSAVNNIITINNGEVFALEDVQYQQNVKVFKVLCELLGCISVDWQEKNYLYTIIPPVTWHSSCKIKGRKRADVKKNTMAFVKTRFGIDVEEDAADAIGIAYHMATCLNTLNTANMTTVTVKATKI